MTFPNGSVAEVSSVYALFTNSLICKSPADRTEGPITGDSPPSTLVPFSLPLMNNLWPLFGQVLRVALYDWIRRGGSRLNVQSLVGALSTPLNANPNPHADMLKIDVNGNVAIKTVPTDPNAAPPVSQKQWWSVSGLALHSSNNKYYDIYVRDFVFQPGTLQGGLHAGELLGQDNSAPPPPPPPGGPPPGVPAYKDPASATKFPIGPPGGAIRPTYQQDGIAADIRFRMR